MDTGHPVTNLGYGVADVATGPSGSLKFHGVNLDNVASARLALSTWYLNSPPDAVSKFVLRYRWNGGPWRDRPVTAEAIATLTGGTKPGASPPALHRASAHLDPGHNTRELVNHTRPQ